MESPLLTKSEHNVEDVTIHVDSSKNDDHTIDITTHADSSSNDDQIVDITTHGDSSSSDEQTPATPHEDIQWRVPFTDGFFWFWVELAVTLVQIGAAIYLLTLKDEQNQKPKLPLFIWAICYTCASIATLPFVCCYREKFVEYIMVCLVMIFLMEFLAELTSPGDTTQHLWLWFGLLAFSCVRYVLPNLKWAVSCFMWPVAFTVQKLWEAIGSMLEAIVKLFFTIILVFGAFVYTCCCCCGACLE